MIPDERHRSGEHTDPRWEMCFGQLASIFKELKDFRVELNAKDRNDALAMAALHTRVSLLEAWKAAREKSESDTRERSQWATGTIVAIVVAAVEIIHYFQH